MSEPYKKILQRKFDDIESLESIKFRIDDKDSVKDIIESVVKEIKATLYITYKEKWRKGELK